jgi:predicted transcriptional regulator
MATNKKFALWLDNTMSNEEMSGRTLANLLGVNDSQVSRWRHGDGIPRPDTIGRLAEIFKVDTMRLLQLSGVVHLPGVEPLPIPTSTGRLKRLETRIYSLPGLSRAEAEVLVRTLRDINNAG